MKKLLILFVLIIIFASCSSSEKCGDDYRKYQHREFYDIDHMK